MGTYTVSRPVYALLSTGLEVDRTGARNNEQTAPLVPFYDGLGKLRRVDGVGTPDEITERLTQVLG